ncbi:MAG: hypothetical protein QN173_06380 [Armatimonadota bacterium]|nr:hypothetical protein [Armatimonadota bacterium]MDR7437035.1 hypothetical protein [Armatimonadota bacterium]MDR7472894.1 hypothetical protein [Armatimonadota bacterium]MDR7507216.1 hypothetical protein [Armatimonadota bacterium]MDR7508921.1 hypothetical protein [Armatimonadota bacterium]
MGSVVHPTLARVTARAAWRLAARRALEWAAVASVLTLSAHVLLLAAGLVVPLAPPSVAAAVFRSAVAAACAALAAAVCRRPDELAAARVLDDVLGLDERASTAVEVARRPAGPLAPRVVADAVAHLHGADLRAVLPVRPPRLLAWVPLLVVALAAWPLRGLAIPGTPAHRAQQVIRREAARLERVSRILERQARADRLPLTRRAAREMRAVGERLRQERLDRAAALARVADLAREVHQWRQDLDRRLEQASATPAGAPPDSLRRSALQRQIRQLQEALSHLQSDDPAAAREGLDRLGEVLREGEGTAPAEVRQQLRRARQQLDDGDVSGAGESLTQALRWLAGLEGLAADREGLERAQQELDSSMARIASGSSSAAAETPGADSSEAVAPGDRSPVADADAGEPPPQGSREGSLPGTGRAGEQAGPPTPRLDVEKIPQRVRGAPGQGEATASEVVGPGRLSATRVQPARVPPAVVVRADRALQRARVPAAYRRIVQDYFRRLAGLR